MSHGGCCTVMCAYCVLVRCDVVRCAVLCCDLICLYAICFEVLGCAVMHGVLSAMCYWVERFTEMSHGGCCTVICVYCVLVTCDLVWCAVLCCDVMCLTAICFDVFGCAVMYRVLSAMWYCVVRFAEMLHGGCCTVLCAYCKLVRCDVIRCAVICCDVIC